MPPRKRKMESKEETNTSDEEVAVEAKRDAKKKAFSIFDKPGAKPVKEMSGEGESNGKNSKDDESKGEWLEHGEKVKNLRPLFYHFYKELEGCEKVAAFDIDFTIIRTKSGKKFPTDAKDWTWFDKSVIENLRELNKSGYRVIFITNQAGIEKGRAKFSELKSKFQSIISQLQIPVFVYVATGENHFRKPSTEIWSFFTTACNKSVTVDMDASFYVGDAAGRPKGWAVGKEKDFSCADRMFAHNCGLKFLTPEEYFLKQKVATFEWRTINPVEVLRKLESKIKLTKTDQFHLKEKEIILFVGPPASGKSTFTRRHLLPFNYVHINRDTLTTQANCLKATATALSEGKSVVVDNTNPTKAIRADYVALAKKSGVKQIRCFKMNTDIELCHHLNYVRQNQSRGGVRRIPDVGYNMYKSRYEEPEVSEGFTEIVKIEFNPQFDSEEHKKIFKQWTA